MARASKDRRDGNGEELGRTEPRHLRSVIVVPQDTALFPFSLPIIRDLGEISFTRAVTFLVGENGTGKSTLLEAMAVAAEVPAIGDVDMARDPSLEPARRLAAAMRLTWTKRTRRGFFMRAEDFFAFVKRVNAAQEDFADLEHDYSERLEGYGRQLAMGVARGARAGLAARYGDDLDANSHGESFLKVLQERIAPGGVYFLDEPETPLSPQRQMALIGLILDGVRANAQFVIATHSPILMALPGAQLLVLDNGAIRECEYEQLEHVTFTRDFLNAPERYLRHL